MLSINNLTLTATYPQTLLTGNEGNSARSTQPIPLSYLHSCLTFLKRSSIRSSLAEVPSVEDLQEFIRIFEEAYQKFLLGYHGREPPEDYEQAYKFAVYTLDFVSRP